MLNNKKIAFYIFYVGLFGLSVSISVSKFATSVGMILMVVGWLIKWDWLEKANKLKANKSVLLVSVSIFLIYVIGTVHSENMSYALKDLKIKLPIFLLPFLLATSFDIKKKHIVSCFVLMTSSAIFATIIGFATYLNSVDNEFGVMNLRMISPFISLIRLSLILSIGYGLGLWGLTQLKSHLKWLIFIPLSWIIFIFVFSESLTGLFFIPIITLFFILFLFKKFRKVTIGVSIIIFSAFLVISFQIYSIYNMVFQTVELPTLEKTINGNNYNHYENTTKENGFYTYKHICYSEIEREWNKRSHVLYSSIKNGSDFSAIIFRYLSSKGLKKDSIGLSQISDIEIKAIEAGITNEFILHANPIQKIIHKLFWEFNEAIESGRYKGNSVTSRLVFAVTGLKVASNNFIFGVGIGDVKEEMLKEYKRRPNYQEEQFFQSAHNQFITTAVGLGFVGLSVLVFSMFYLLRSYSGSMRYLFLLIQGILIFSMFWEDTLETQAGVAIFSLSLNIFLFENKSGYNSSIN